MNTRYINPKFKFYVFQDFIKGNKDKTRQLKVHAKCMKIMQNKADEYNGCYKRYR